MTMAKIKQAGVHKEILNFFGGKSLLFAHWDAEDPQVGYSYDNWYRPMKKLFGKVVTFPAKKIYFGLGKEEMNKRFLELVKKEKPDYAFFLLIYDEFDPSTFLKLKEISPNTKIFNLLSDDSWRYEDYGRYWALLSDYIVTTGHKAIKLHKKEGIKNIFFASVVNLEHFKPLNLEKRYDVVFIGTSGKERIESIKFLRKNGIKVDIFGKNWHYDEFNSIYHGPLDSDELIKKINQSKINLSISVGVDTKPQIKGRPFEVSACRSFVLESYFPDYLDFFEKDKEIVMFKNKEEMLEKVKYYLKHEKEREKIAQAAYEKVVKKYSVDAMLNEFLGKVMEDEKKKILIKFPQAEVKEKIAYLSGNDLKQGMNELKNKLENFDYVCFNSDTISKIHSIRNYFQAYSLKKSGKQISCCDYYVHSKHLGNYMLFKANLSFGRLPKSEFDKLLDISQIMVKKDFLFQHIKDFKDFFKKKKFNLITEKNTVFISIPLVEIKKMPDTANAIDYKYMKIAFQMLFLNKLYSLSRQKKLFSGYLLMLIIEALKGKSFIFNALKDAVYDKNKMNRLKKGF